ncbi:MAG: NADPH-dependent F420 reductase [Gammaproteobacteria bacterium]|nr:MAG: NADPH-dependent F420 reductase [Gammaproteobacteria bacterium]
MELSTDIKTISLIGGTGALGTGLARRWAKAGYQVIIGSRKAEKAVDAATTLNNELPEAAIEGLQNRAAAAAGDIVVLTVPFAHQRPTLEDIRGELAGKILVDTTVPLVPPKVARVQMPAEGCAAIIAQQIVGEDVMVVSAFQNVAADLMASDAEMACDVLVAGNKLAAREIVIQLAGQAKFNAWHAGPLANSAAMEALTSVLIFINKRYPGSHAGVRMTGISTT